MQTTPKPSSHPLFPSPILALLALLHLTACGHTSPGMDIGGPVTPTAWTRTSSATERDHHATARVLHAQPQRLRSDIQRAVASMHWAVLRFDTQADPVDPGSVRAWAAMPEGRIATILLVPDDPHALAAATQRHADPVAPSHLDTQTAPQAPVTLTAYVRVGHFGDPDLEKHFLDELQQTLTKAPLPQRGGVFQIPPFLPTPQLHDLRIPDVRLRQLFGDTD